MYMYIYYMLNTHLSQRGKGELGHVRGKLFVSPVVVFADLVDQLRELAQSRLDLVLGPVECDAVDGRHDRLFYHL